MAESAADMQWEPGWYGWSEDENDILDPEGNRIEVDELITMVNDVVLKLSRKLEAE